jgi:hypothetical protein
LTGVSTAKLGAPLLTSNGRSRMPFYNDAVVEMHRSRAAGEGAGLKAVRIVRRPGIQFVHKALGEFHEAARGAQATAVFARVAGMGVFEQQTPSSLRAPYRSSTVVICCGMVWPPLGDQDVDWPHVGGQFPQELAIRLVAYMDFDAAVAEILQPWIDIDAADSTVRPEVVSPHVQRASVEHAELDNGDRPAAEPFEVAMVDVEVVIPLGWKSAARDCA